MAAYFRDCDDDSACWWYRKRSRGGTCEGCQMPNCERNSQGNTKLCCACFAEYQLQLGWNFCSGTRCHQEAERVSRFREAWQKIGHVPENDDFDEEAKSSLRGPGHRIGLSLPPAAAAASAGPPGPPAGRRPPWARGPPPPPPPLVTAAGVWAAPTTPSSALGANDDDDDRSNLTKQTLAEWTQRLQQRQEQTKKLLHHIGSKTVEINKELVALVETMTELQRTVEQQGRDLEELLAAQRVGQP